MSKNTRKTNLLLIILIFSLLKLNGVYSTSGNLDDNLNPNQSNELTIISRHDIAILNEFRDAFLNSEYGSNAGFSSGDTDKINFLTLSSLTAWQNALNDDATGVDLAWGGGPTLFGQIAELGLFSPITDTELLDILNETIPETISGAEMRGYKDGEIIWVSNALSSFGFTVNHAKLEEYGLDLPQTWDDLASPDFYIDEKVHSIAMGNAPETTSNTRIYQIILQNYGWNKGWEIIKGMAGNGGIYGGSVATRAAVIQGQVPVALTIDFYGVFAQRENEKTEYIIPTNQSIINGDPIAFGGKSGNPSAAKEFFKFVNSNEGQAIWVNNDRLPMREDAFNTTIGQSRTDVYELYNRTLSNQGIEFDEPKAGASYFSLVDLFDATITSSLSNLKAAWAAITEDYISGTITLEEYNILRAELTKPEITEQEALNINDQLLTDSQFRSETKSTWTKNANDHYKSYLPSQNRGSPLNSFSTILGFSVLVILIRRKGQKQY